MTIHLVCKSEGIIEISSDSICGDIVGECKCGAYEHWRFDSEDTSSLLKVLRSSEWVKRPGMRLYQEGKHYGRAMLAKDLKTLEAKCLSV